VARAGQFVEQVHVADFAVTAPKPVTLPVTEVTTRPSVSQEGLPPVLEPLLDPLEELWQALVLGARDYVHNNGFTDICFGLSGGIDSALTAAIAAEALGPEHVHAVMMPSRYSSDHSLTDSEKLCQNLGINSRVVPIEPAHSSFLEMLAPSFGDDPPGLTEENLQSRIRGVTLMALSNKFGWLVLTTGNKSELAVGYSTLYGDTAGAYAVIKDLWKLQVYELSEHVNRRAGQEIIPASTITKPPSAELRPDQRDDQSLPPYEILDPMLIELVERNRTAADLVADGHDPAVVTRIARLVDIAEFKRRQTPLGTRATGRAFGRDRRMPVTNQYRGNPPSSPS
ncbi:MAG: NAD(+) synthase, partial [Actinomycetota bacterium]